MTLTLTGRQAGHVLNVAAQIAAQIAASQLLTGTAAATAHTVAGALGMLAVLALSVRAPLGPTAGQSTERTTLEPRRKATVSFSVTISGNTDAAAESALRDKLNALTADPANGVLAATFNGEALTLPPSKLDAAHAALAHLATIADVPAADIAALTAALDTLAPVVDLTAAPAVDPAAPVDAPPADAAAHVVAL